MKTIASLFLLILNLSGLSQIESKITQLSKADSLILIRYNLVFSKVREMIVPLDLGASLAISFGSDLKSALQSKKMSTKQQLIIDNSSKIAIVGCRPNFIIEKNVDTSCELKVVENAGLSISKDIAHLVTLRLKYNIDNKNVNIFLLDSAFINEIPFEHYSFSKSIIAGPTKIWGTSKLPECSWSNGVSVSRKPKIKKEYKFFDKANINGKYKYILTIWPYMWFSGWANYEEYSMYIIFSLIDGSSGQILGSGLFHSDKFCNAYCGMEVAWNASIEISSQLLKTLSTSK